MACSEQVKKEDGEQQPVYPLSVKIFFPPGMSTTAIKEKKQEKRAKHGVKRWTKKKYQSQQKTPNWIQRSPASCLEALQRDSICT